MGAVYKRSIKYLSDPLGQNIMVEIGSDRYEGSTQFLADLAQSRDQILHTIDIDKSASMRINHPCIKWHHFLGSEWCENILPKLECKIDLLYLDNFDYDWNISLSNKMINEQKKSYQESFNLEMTNQNCQLEHMRQAVGCLPYMNRHGVIVCDDTYLWNDCWVGKCGPVVVWLQAHGWVLREMFDHGVVLTSAK